MCGDRCSEAVESRSWRRSVSQRSAGLLWRRLPALLLFPQGFELLYLLPERRCTMTCGSEHLHRRHVRTAYTSPGQTFPAPPPHVWQSVGDCSTWNKGMFYINKTRSHKMACGSMIFPWLRGFFGRAKCRVPKPLCVSIILKPAFSPQCDYNLIVMVTVRLLRKLFLFIYIYRYTKCAQGDGFPCKNATIGIKNQNLCWKNYSLQILIINQLLTH